MKILNMGDSKLVDFQCDFSDDEYKILLEYAEDNIPPNELEGMKINWAVVSLLTKYVEDKEKEKNDDGIC